MSAYYRNLAALPSFDIVCYIAGLQLEGAALQLCRLWQGLEVQQSNLMMSIPQKKCSS